MTALQCYGMNVFATQSQYDFFSIVFSVKGLVDGSLGKGLALISQFGAFTMGNVDL